MRAHKTWFEFEIFSTHFELECIDIYAVRLRQIFVYFHLEYTVNNDWLKHEKLICIEQKNKVPQTKKKKKTKKLVAIESINYVCLKRPPFVLFGQNSLDARSNCAQ